MNSSVIKKVESSKMSIVQSEKNGDITCSPTAINSSPTDILPEIK
jgi:hypothetical protein